MNVKSESEVAQLCLTLSDLIDCSLPGSSVHGIFQARVLEWGAIALNAVLGCNLKNDRMTSLCFQGKPLSITVIQVYASQRNADEGEIDRFYEDLQQLLEVTQKKLKRCTFHHMGLECKSRKSKDT